MVARARSPASLGVLFSGVLNVPVTCGIVCAESANGKATTVKRRKVASRRVKFLPRLDSPSTWAAPKILTLAPLAALPLKNCKGERFFGTVRCPLATGTGRRIFYNTSSLGEVPDFVHSADVGAGPSFVAAAVLVGQQIAQGGMKIGFFCWSRGPPRGS